MKPDRDLPKDFEEAPESDSARKFVRHIIDEMPWRVVGAIAFVVFFFAYGAVNSIFKLTGRDLASLPFALGPYAGLVAAIVVTGWIARVKYRTRR